MMNAQLLFMSEYARRLEPRLLPVEEVSPDSRLRRLIVRMGRRLRWHAPLPNDLSEHLCRDIGIDVPPKQPEVFWPW